MKVVGPFADSRIAGTHEWLTPRWIVDALGPFDLDPCAPPPERRLWATASQHYDETQDGLSLPWHGLVWCNPPYGPHTKSWLRRCADHGDAIALVCARTDTRWFHEHVAPRATAVLFLRGWISFLQSVTGRVCGTPAAPSILVAYGERAADRLRALRDRGALVRFGDVRS